MKEIAINIEAIRQEHLEVICSLLGFKLTGFDKFFDSGDPDNFIQVYFECNMIKDPNKHLEIKENGVIYVFFDALDKERMPINIISVVIYLQKKGLLFQQPEISIMEKGVEVMENAIWAARDIGLKEVPLSWLAYLSSGWQIQSRQCGC